jgi:hypothetical protein
VGDHAHWTVEKLAEGQFPPGPKIQAAVEFVEKGMKRAVVCRPEGVVEWMNVYLSKVIWNSGIRQCVRLVNNSSLIHTGQK